MKQSAKTGLKHNSGEKGDRGNSLLSPPLASMSEEEKTHNLIILINYGAANFEHLPDHAAWKALLAPRTRHCGPDMVARAPVAGPLVGLI